MDTSAIKNLRLPKIVILFFSALILIIVLGLFFNTSENEIVTSTTTPTPTKQNRQLLPATPPDKQVTGQIVVKFKDSYTTAQITEHLKEYNATIIKKIQGINYTVIKVPNGQENTIIEKMKKDPYVEKALPDFTNHTTFIPNDTYFQNQYGFNNTGQAVQGNLGTPHADINVVPAWDATKGNGIKVAVLDSGIDLNHPDLANKVVAQKQFSTSAIDASIQDKNGHGTHVAGIIAADTNNASGVAGTCPGCQLIIGKVVTNDASGNATGATSDIVSGITWAADQGAKVLNLSLRTTTSGSAPLYQSAIDYANAKGAVVVVAAGNDASNAQVWPAANNGVVSVAATDNTDRMASFSNFGTFVRVAAPGVNIVSTLPTTTNAKKVLNYGYLSGTSMASPMVSGVIALIWSSQYGTSNTAVINRLYATADKIAGTGTNWTEGRVNAGKAVGAITPTPSPVPTVVFPSPYCVGGNGQPPCATIPPSNGSTVAPTQSITSVPPVTGSQPGTTTIPGVTNGPNVTNGPLTTTAPTGSGGGGNPGTNPTVPCPALDKLFASAADTNETAGHHHRHKHHRKSHHHKNGFFSQMLELLLKLIAYLIQLIGLGNLCGNTPTPSVTPTPGITQTPSDSPSPTDEPGLTEEPNPTDDLTPTVEPTAETASPTPTGEVTTVPPVNGVNQ